MLVDYVLGQTSIILRVKLRNSSVATGAGLTGLTSSSSGLIISTIADNESTATAYTQAGSTIETITTLGTFATPTATKCRFKEVDSTNHKGVYEIQLDNTRYAVSNAKSLIISILGATNLAECDVLIPLRSVNPYDSVRMGMTALPNAAAEAAGGLYTRGTGAGQVAQDANGEIRVNVNKWLNGAIPAVNVTGVPKVDIVDWLGSAPDALSSGKVPADLKLWLASAPDALSSGKIPADLKLWLASAPAALSTNGYVQAMLLRWLTDNAGGTPNALSSNRVDASVGAYPGNTAQTGDNYARLGAPAGASVSADVAAVKTDTGNLVTRITSSLFSGITSLAQWLGALAGKQVANTTARTEIRATGTGSGTFDETTDSLESLRDNLATASALSTVQADTDDIQSRLPSALVSGRMDSSVGSYPGNTAQTGDAYARLGAPAGASTSADIAAVKTDSAAIKAKTDNLPASPAAVGSNMGTVSSVIGNVGGNVGGNVVGSVGSISGVTFPTNFSALSIDSSGRVTLTYAIHKNSALSNFEFPMMDSSDHVTPKTGLTVTATRSIDGAAFGSCANSPSEIGSSGVYKIDLAAADLNGNVITFKFTAPGADITLLTVVTQG